MFYTAYIFIVWDYLNSTLKDKQCKQQTSLKSYKTQIKILANPGLAGAGGKGVGKILES